MTDLLKDHIAPDASSVEEIDAEVMDRNVQLFRDEMDVLGADASTLFVLFGRQARRLFCEHPSFYGVTTDAWVEEARNGLTDHWNRAQRIDRRNDIPELNTSKFTP